MAAWAASEPMSELVSGVIGSAAVRCTAKAPSMRSPMAMGYTVIQRSPRALSGGTSTKRGSVFVSVQMIGSRCCTTQPTAPSPSARSSCSSAASS